MLFVQNIISVFVKVQFLLAGCDSIILKKILRILSNLMTRANVSKTGNRKMTVRKNGTNLLAGFIQSIFVKFNCHFVSLNFAEFCVQNIVFFGHSHLIKYPKIMLDY